MIPVYSDNQNKHQMHCVDNTQKFLPLQQVAHAEPAVLWKAKIEDLN